MRREMYLSIMMDRGSQVSTPTTISYPVLSDGVLKIAPLLCLVGFPRSLRGFRRFHTCPTSLDIFFVHLFCCCCCLSCVDVFLPP